MQQEKYSLFSLRELSAATPSLFLDVQSKLIDLNQPYKRLKRYYFKSLEHY